MNINIIINLGNYIDMFRMTWEWRMSSWKPWRPYRPQRGGRRSTQSEKTNLLHESKQAKHTNNTGSPAPQNIKIKLSTKTLAGSGPYPHLHPNQVSSGVEMIIFRQFSFVTISENVRCHLTYFSAGCAHTTVVALQARFFTFHWNILFQETVSPRCLLSTLALFKQTPQTFFSNQTWWRTGKFIVLNMMVMLLKMRTM